MLLAGVSGVPLIQFAGAVAFGRGFRYFGEGWLAVRYGETAVEMLEQNGRMVSLVLAGLVLIASWIDLLSVDKPAPARVRKLTFCRTLGTSF